MVGLLAGNSDWLVKSNVEAGDGFADIIVETEDIDAGIIVELKHSKTFSGMDKACEKQSLRLEIEDIMSIWKMTIDMTL